MEKERYKVVLEGKKRKLLEDIEGIQARTFSQDQKEITGEMSSYDQHSADLASSTFERGKDLGLKQRLGAELGRVEMALEKFEAGSYALCVMCGKAIPKERLDVIPEARFCIDCQRQEEALYPFKRSVEEDFDYDYVLTGIEERADRVASNEDKLPQEE